MDWTYLSEIMKTLGHPVRLRLIAHLCHGDDNVGAMADLLEVRPAVVSQQLAILRMRGFVSKTQVGGRALYTLAEPRLRDLLGCVIECKRPLATALPPDGEGPRGSGDWAGAPTGEKS